MRLEQYLGDDVTHVVELLLDGAAFDPAGHTLIFTVKERPTDLDLAAIFQRTSGLGLTTSSESGQFYAHIEVIRNQTINSTPGDKYYGIRAQNNTTGLSRTVAKGIITFERDVTREVSISVPIPSEVPPPGFLPLDPEEGQIIAFQGGVVQWADPEAASAPSWDNIIDKPVTFEPTAHNHDASEVNAGTLHPDRLGSGTGLQVVRRNAGNTALEYATISVGGGDLVAANNLSDVANPATAFGNIKQAATESVTGVVELATSAETDAGKAIQASDTRLSNPRTPTAHASAHVNGTDDIQSATSSQKGLATATQITKLDSIEASADVTDAVNVGSSIHGSVEKTTPVDADTVPLIDSAASNVLKKLTWANIKAALNSLYAAVAHNHAAGDINSGTLSADRLASGTGLQVLRRNAGNTALEFATISVGGGDLVAANNLSDVASAATAFSNIKQAATESVTGVVELATSAETDAGKVVQASDTRLSDDRDPTNHASNHTNGTDDIQSATSAQKGLATAAQITKLDGIEAAADVTDATNVGAAINGATEKTTLANGDKFSILDSAASNVLKWISWTNIKTALDALYAAATHASSHHIGGSDPVRVYETITVAMSPQDATAVTVGTKKAFFKLQWAMTVTSVHAYADGAPTGSTLTIDINEDGVSILSTKLTIDASENDSADAATAAVISDASLAAGSLVSFDFDTVGSTFGGSGVVATLNGYRT